MAENEVARSLVAVAEVTKVFGIKGQLVARPFSEDSRIAARSRVFVGVSDTQTVVHRVDQVEQGGRGLRITLAGIRTREEAKKLVGSLMFVEESDLRKLAPGEFFVHQLIGLRVVGESGKEVGILKDVLKMPAQDVYVVEKDGREIMIPAVKELVREIRPDQGYIVVKVIEGLEQE